jgi:tetratricopeptide (TPR) repeat protein
MFPYLTPYGIIMKINRNPLAELSADVIQKDHEFWSKYSDRLIGNWITYDTTVSEICDFAEKVYLRRDFNGFKGDRKFVRDDNAQKAFSKLRSSIAGVYAWRMSNAKNSDDQQRMMKEADFAFKQAFAYCPYSPEAVFRYVNVLLSANRIDDAIRIVQTCLKLDRFNTTVEGLLNELTRMKSNPRGGTTDAAGAIAMVNQFLQEKKTNDALRVLDSIVASPMVDPATILQAAHLFATLGQAARLEATLIRLTRMLPDNPEAFYDLAYVQSAIGKTPAALESLREAIRLSKARKQKDPAAPDMAEMARTDARFEPLRAMPEFQAIINAR